MERLTQNDFDMCKECPDNLRCEHASNETFPPCGDKAIYERLKAYERTGMEPCDYSAMREQMKKGENAIEHLMYILHIMGNIGLDRFMELAKAEQEGRLVVLQEPTKGE